MRSRIAYVSFDAVPAPKGAATHIQAFVQALARDLGPIDLVTVGAGPSEAPVVERWPGIFHYELPAMGKSLIDRVLCFRVFLLRWLAKREFEAIQFRSIFEGGPLRSSRKQARLIFEVNGLPSIELKYRYPRVVDDRELMRKLVAQEAACLDSADLIVTPSGVTRDYLATHRHLPPSRIEVIPNGVDLELFTSSLRPSPNGVMGLIYFGTLASWQGVELAIRAVAQLQGRLEASLTIVGAGTGRQRDSLAALASKLGIGARVHVLQAMPQAELAERLRSSDAVLVPLALTDRNTLQGCCPLKALEGMASGAPVIATDLPVVRELGRDGEHFLLVRPGSVDHMAETIARLRSDRTLAARIAENARNHVAANFSWDRAGHALVAAYGRLGIQRSRNS